MGVWIEIFDLTKKHPTSPGVTPCVGVWIEIEKEVAAANAKERHSLRGSVD